MVRLRWLAIAIMIVLPLAVELPVVAAAGPGIEVRGVRYNRQQGVVTVRMRWLPELAARMGKQSDHLVLLGRDSDGYVVVRDERVEPAGQRRTRHRIELTRSERARLGGGATVLVAATHKVDDDGGRFDHVWYDARGAGGSPRTTPTEAQADCGLIEAGADLAGCSLAGANLTYADLSGANLSGADLSSAIVAVADLEDANLDDAVLIGAYLSSSNMAGVSASAANASDADLNATILTNATLTGITFRDAILDYAHMGSTNLVDANLSGASLNGTDLTEANLTGANMSGADVSGVIYCDTILPDGTVSYYGC